MTKEDTIRTMEMALREALADYEPTLTLSVRNMFGGAGFYANGMMFAAWYGNGLALKLPDDARAELLRTSGALAAQSPQYVEVPPAYLEDPSLLRPWAVRSVDYARRQPPRPRRRRG